MADTKVSALSAASALAGTEVVPGVQSSASVKITIDQIGTRVQAQVAASAANQETGTSTTVFVTPGVQARHPSAAKAWAMCDVAGAVTTGFNVPSCADGGAGITTVTIGTDFSSANWCCVVGGNGSGTAVTNAHAVSSSSQAAGTVILSSYDFSATPVLEDPINFFFAGFGDQ